MTPLVLQDDLAEEIRNILSGYMYKTPAGGLVPMNVFTQHIRVNETDEEDDPVPYVIVRLNKGEDSGARDSFNIVKVILIVGIWDDTPEAQGHRSVMNVIQKIYERFHKNPCLNNKAVYSGAFDWALQEDTYYPYSFGACSLSFHIPAIRREDPFT